MKLARELAELHKKMVEVMEACNDIQTQIYMDIENPPEKRLEITKAIMGRGENTPEFQKLAAAIKTYKAAEIGPVPEEQRSINNFIEMEDFFQKVFRE